MAPVGRHLDCAPVRLGIVGTGLMGASVGLAAKRAGVERVLGVDSDPAAARRASERGALDEVTADLDEADLVVVAAPVGVLPAVVRDVLAHTRNATVTDVGSTKAAVARATAGDSRFVGGHPVTGSETHGPARATAELFYGATWFLTPSAATDPAVANLLLNQAGKARVGGHEPLAAAGGSLRDMTRVAGGANLRIWADIFLEHAEPLRAALAEHRRRVEELDAALAVGDAAYIARWIREAAANRRRMLETAYSDPGALHRLRIHVPDRPGVLAGITQALGAERINIKGLRTAAHVAQARRHARRARRRREGGAAGGGSASGKGLRRRRLAGARAPLSQRVTAEA